MFPKSVANVRKAERNIFRGSPAALQAFWQEHAWQPARQSGRPAETKAEYAWGASCSRSLSARRIRRIQSRSRRHAGVSREPSVSPGLWRSPERFQVMGRLPRKASQVLLVEIRRSGRYRAKTGHSTVPARPGSRRTRSIGLRVLFSRRRRQPAAGRAGDGVAHLVFVRCNCPRVRRTDLRLRHRKRVPNPKHGLFFVLNGRVRKLFPLRRGSV